MFVRARTSWLSFVIVTSIFATVAIVSIILVPPASRAKINHTSNVSAKKGRRPEYVPGEVLIRYRNEAVAEEKTRAAAIKMAVRGEQLQIRVERFAGSELLPGARLIRVTPELTLQTVAALRQQPDVLYAEPNYILHSDVNPNDTRFLTDQWNLMKIGAPQAYDTIRGSKNTPEPPFFGNPQIVIAVLDQGIDTNHQDLQANVWVNPSETLNGVDDDGNGRIDDINGFNFVNNTGTVFSGQNSETHATHVAGIAGAVGNNNKGISGVNWAVGLMSLKFLDALGGGSIGDAIKGVQYAKLMRDLWLANSGTKGANIRVINASFGGGAFSQMFEDAIGQANNSGILFVAAAGNVEDGSKIPNNDLVPHYPSSLSAPNIISVAATNQSDGLPSFSHFGATSVDLGAPGTAILSTTPPCTLMPPDPDICAPNFTDPNGDSYTVLSGTSMSASHVSGAAALLWARNPNLTVQQVKDMILLGGDVAPALVGKTLTGRRLNVNGSLISVNESDAINPGAVTNFHINSQNGRAVNLGWIAAGDDGAGGGNASLYRLFFTDTAPGSTPIPLMGLVPAAPGVGQTADVIIPLRHTSGTLTLREFDNRGNEGTPQSVSVNVPLDIADPYNFVVGCDASLTTDTTQRLNLNDDDVYADFLFPTGFSFPFFGTTHSEVKVSSNGVLYFGDAPLRDNGEADDVPSSPRALGGFQMIAGLWDDLNLKTSPGPLVGRPDAGVYVVRPSPNRLIFRWQAKPCNFDGIVCLGGADVNFEIELRTDGTIQIRYGSGNVGMFPTVGIANGSPDAYVITSHTDETSPKNLTNAPEVIFTPRSLGNLPTLQLSQANYNVNEGGGSVTITVTRTGATSGTSTFDYATSDTDNFTVNCANKAGQGFARCDFGTSVDTLTFAPGETMKSFQIPIMDDTYAEGNETFTLRLSNAAGASIACPGKATITINDNETVDGANPIFTTSFFVRQHYLDFLSREPEAGEPWSGVLNNCSDVNNNPQCDRLTVSGAFFGSPEFQLKGYFVYRFYKLAFNRLPRYTEIVVDMRTVTGATPTEVFAKKVAFTNNFVFRSEFTALSSMSNTNFVNTLMDRYNLQSVTTPDPAAPDGTIKVTLTRTNMISALNGATLTRAQVLRAIADSDQVFQLEFNSAFVAMQYFGYLRRDPDGPGFNSWLNFLNLNPTESRTMINGFMNSAEYRLRFGT